MLKNDFYGKEITTMMILHSKLFSADKIFCGIFVILTSILLRHYFIQTPIPNTPIANFTRFDDFATSVAMCHVPTPFISRSTPPGGGCPRPPDAGLARSPAVKVAGNAV